MAILGHHLSYACLQAGHMLAYMRAVLSHHLSYACLQANRMLANKKAIYLLTRGLYACLQEGCVLAYRRAICLLTWRPYACLHEVYVGLQESYLLTYMKGTYLLTRRSCPCLEKVQMLAYKKAIYCDSSAYNKNLTLIIFSCFPLAFFLYSYLSYVGYNNISLWIIESPFKNIRTGVNCTCLQEGPMLPHKKHINAYKKRMLAYKKQTLAQSASNNRLWIKHRFKYFWSNETTDPHQHNCSKTNQTLPQFCRQSISHAISV